MKINASTTRRQFITRASTSDRVEIERTFRDGIARLGDQLRPEWIDVAKLAGLDQGDDRVWCDRQPAALPPACLQA